MISSWQSSKLGGLDLEVSGWVGQSPPPPRTWKIRLARRPTGSTSKSSPQSLKHTYKYMYMNLGSQVTALQRISSMADPLDVHIHVLVASVTEATRSMVIAVQLDMQYQQIALSIIFLLRENSRHLSALFLSRTLHTHVLV